MKSFTKRHAAAAKYAAKARALHTDAWYEDVGNSQVLRCPRWGSSGVASLLFYKQRSQTRGFSSLCRPCQLAANSDNRCRNRYGISYEERLNMWRMAGGHCAICGEFVQQQDFHLDHDHVTGAIRGVLCGPCNLGLGSFHDSRGNLLRAARYLARANKQP